MTSILQPWVMELGLRHQGVIVSAMRGCDNAERNDNSKALQRLLRGAVLVPHCGRFVQPDSYIIYEPDHGAWWRLAKSFLENHDHYPNHYVLHFTHTTQVIGYHGPLEHPVYSDRWNAFYHAIVHKFHLNPETKQQMDARLNADGEAFNRMQHFNEKVSA